MRPPHPSRIYSLRRVILLPKFPLIRIFEYRFPENPQFYRWTPSNQLRSHRGLHHRELPMLLAIPAGALLAGLDIGFILGFARFCARSRSRTINPTINPTKRKKKGKKIENENRRP